MHFTKSAGMMPLSTRNAATGEMHDLTVLVLTYNERENIGRTLEAVRWAARVVIVDSLSTDGTVEMARSYENVTVCARAFDTHTRQWNFGLDQMSTNWVLSLDADYELSAELSEEIQNLTPSEEVGGYVARFQFRVFGHRLRASVYPPRTVLFRRDRARYEDDGHTQLLRCAGVVRTLGGLIFHDDRKPLSRWVQSQDRYMVIEAGHLLSLRAEQLTKQDRLRRETNFAPLVMCLYLLFARGLIFDGWPGWYYVYQRTLAETLLRLRLITEQQRLERLNAGGSPGGA